MDLSVVAHVSLSLGGIYKPYICASSLRLFVFFRNVLSWLHIISVLRLKLLLSQIFQCCSGIACQSRLLSSTGQNQGHHF